MNPVPDGGSARRTACRDRCPPGGSRPVATAAGHCLLRRHCRLFLYPHLRRLLRAAHRPRVRTTRALLHLGADIALSVRSSSGSSAGSSLRNSRSSRRRGPRHRHRYLSRGFSAIYLAISHGNGGNFTEPLDHIRALYLTITVFSTVGFGDITPRTDCARVLVVCTDASGSGHHRCRRPAALQRGQSRISPAASRRYRSSGVMPRRGRRLSRCRYGAGGTQPPRDGYAVGGCAPAARSRRLRRCTIRPASRSGRGRPWRSAFLRAGRAAARPYWESARRSRRGRSCSARCPRGWRRRCCPRSSRCSTG